MTRKDKSQSVWLKGHFSVSFFFAVIALMIFNVVTTLKLNDIQQKQVVLKAHLEKEESHSEELRLLEKNHKRVESEYLMMEHGLRELYKEKSTRLREFVPVFQDQIVFHRTHQFGGRTYETFFHVPDSGKHQLKVSGSIHTFSSNLRGNNTDDDTITYQDSIPLEPGTTHQVNLSKTVIDGSYVLEVDGDRFFLKAPVIFTESNSFGHDQNRNPRVVSAINQYEVQRPIFSRGASVLGQYIFHSRAHNQMQSRSSFVVQLSIESDGPMTSMPDDPSVVRKLLNDYEAGKTPKFTFNPEGWYEFE